MRTDPGTRWPPTTPQTKSVPGPVLIIAVDALAGKRHEVCPRLARVVRTVGVPLRCGGGLSTQSMKVKLKEKL
jgi:hypothetical protein